MSDLNHPAKRKRAVKVGCTCQQRAGGEVVVPMIRLRGKWLERAGFGVGDSLEVIVGEGEIRLVRRAPLCRKTPRQGELF